MTQFVILVDISMAEVSYISRMLMENVILKFGMCIMVVIDGGNDFRGAFEKICKVKSAVSFRG